MPRSHTVTRAIPDRRTWIRRAVCATMLASTVIVACKDSTAPVPDGLLQVQVGPDSIAGTRSAPWGQFTVQVTLRNTSDEWLAIVSCGPSIEREVAPAQWQIALEPVCALVGGQALKLPPHGELSRSEEIMGSLTATAGPQFLSGGLAGRYRLLYRYAPDGYAGLSPLARSGPFVVTD
jgi:hypothetical protein